MTLKELRTNTEKYEGQKIAVEGTVIYNSNYTAHIVSYDSDTDMYYGMQVYYGYNSNLISVLSVGNKVRIVGTVSYYEAAGGYQISNLSYNMMRPDEPSNTKLISEGNYIEYPEIDMSTLTGKVKLTINGVEKTFDYMELAMNTGVCLKDLKVIDVCLSQSSSPKTTLTCQADDGSRIDIIVDSDVSYLLGETITVRGIIYKYMNTYQINCRKNDIDGVVDFVS